MTFALETVFCVKPLFLSYIRQLTYVVHSTYVIMSCAYFDPNHDLFLNLTKEFWGLNQTPTVTWSVSQQRFLAFAHAFFFIANWAVEEQRVPRRGRTWRWHGGPWVCYMFWHDTRLNLLSHMYLSQKGLHASAAHGDTSHTSPSGWRGINCDLTAQDFSSSSESKAMNSLLF